MKCRDNMLNKLLTLLLIGIIGLSQVNAQNVLANKEGRTVNVKESERDSMKEYYKTFFSGNNKILVTDKNSNDVTEFFLNHTKGWYEEGNIKAIESFAAQKEFGLHLFTVYENETQPYALEQSKTVYDRFTKYYKDNKYGTVMTFTAALYGTFWYNPNTLKITRTNAGTFNVEAMHVPAKMTPLCTDIQTGSYISGGRAYFYANFHPLAYARDENGQVTLEYDYGSQTLSFYATV